MLSTPFFDPATSYAENWETGPFGAFAIGKIYEGPIIPFGIPAGPLLNAKFIKAALDHGFDICVYKTVRTYEKKANPWPNVVAVDIKGDLTMEQARKGVVTKPGFSEPLAITNSFGNPSYPVDVWQPDMADAVKHARPGQQVWGMIEGDNLEGALRITNNYTGQKRIWSDNEPYLDTTKRIVVCAHALNRYVIIANKRNTRFESNN